MWLRRLVPSTWPRSCRWGHRQHGPKRTPLEQIVVLRRSSTKLSLPARPALLQPRRQGHDLQFRWTCSGRSTKSPMVAASVEPGVLRPYFQPDRRMFLTNISLHALAIFCCDRYADLCLPSVTQIPILGSTFVIL